MKEVKELSDKFGNDMEFGKNLRPVIVDSEEFGHFAKEFPNDMDLGKNFRSFLIKTVGY